MKNYLDLIEGKKNLAVVGLGYVGMPLAIEFSKKINVIGFDLNSEKIEMYKSGIDPTNEVGNDEIKSTKMKFTSDINELDNISVYIVAVPTPINLDKTPNLYPVENATKMIASKLEKGSIVVYESTVYPGVTEDICVPILEKYSGLKCGEDFKVGYSPERINPGDKVHTLGNIVKIVSGTDLETVEVLDDIYSVVIKAGIHRAPTIKVAEAAKVVENSQRDINIAFMNELAMVFDRMGIETKSVLEAMNTKWNALGFSPGLVGGHCIGVDPYYFIYEAEKLGYHSQIISSGRKINDGMGNFVAQAVIKQLVLAEKNVKNAKVVILGLTFKENCPDIRNSKVFDIIDTLTDYGINLEFVDPWVDKQLAEKEFDINLSEISQIKNADCLIFAVPHNEFKEINLDKINSLMCKDGKKIVIDVKNIFNSSMFKADDFTYWNL